MQENAERRHSESMILEDTFGGGGGPVSPGEERLASRSNKSFSAPLSYDGSPENQRVPLRSPSLIYDSSSSPESDMELLKERFAKLLLGEDMSGGGQGVPSAVALSNAITNLAEQKRLEPMTPEMKARWMKEIDWLLTVTDYIVEMVPCEQMSKDGTDTMEVMKTRQRKDLNENIPALRDIDTCLIGILDKLKDQSEFYYDSKDGEDRTDEKWWIPTPKVPPGGLSDGFRRWLVQMKDQVKQFHKLAQRTNSEVIGNMDIPYTYLDKLPKNGKQSLGDSIYKAITDDVFDINHFLSNMDLKSDHSILELKNKIEASIQIWKRKIKENKDGKSSWSPGVGSVSSEKRGRFEDRAEQILVNIKNQFPGLPQSALDIEKIQYNRDVGKAILESYSRVLETSAFTIMSRIVDVLNADSKARNLSTGEHKKLPKPPVPHKFASAKEETEKLSPSASPVSTPLAYLIGWEDGEGETDDQSQEKKDYDFKAMTKPTDGSIGKKTSYIERLEHLGGCRSPTARH